MVEGAAVGVYVGAGEGGRVLGTVTLIPKILEMTLTPSLALMFTIYSPAEAAYQEKRPDEILNSESGGIALTA